MMEQDRAKGSVRIVRGEYGYGLEINGDVNSYVLTDATTSIVKANAEISKQATEQKKIDLMVKSGTAVISILALLGSITFLFGGCQQEPQYVHPTQHYPGNY